MPPLSSDPPQGRRPQVVDDLDQAIAAVRRGEPVVLLTDRASAPDAVTARRQLGRSPVPDGGCLALFVSDDSDPVDRELAGAMADELFPLP